MRRSRLRSLTPMTAGMDRRAAHGPDFAESLARVGPVGEGGLGVCPILYAAQEVYERQAKPPG